jgi:hypothetical protein
MSDPVRPPHSPLYPQKTESSQAHLNTTPPLTMPKTATQTHAHPEHPLHSHHAAEKAEALAEKALPGSAIGETELLFERGRPKNGAAIFAALKVMTKH